MTIIRSATVFEDGAACGPGLQLLANGVEIECEHAGSQAECPSRSPSVLGGGPELFVCFRCQHFGDERTRSFLSIA
jgi:hypothetical protein